MTLSPVTRFSILPLNAEICTNGIGGIAKAFPTGMKIQEDTAIAINGEDITSLLLPSLMGDGVSFNAYEKVYEFCFGPSS
eukprot:CAMPEP_0204631052 /NCGR_PEP_ID=MMETSP0717-20131115/21918_1 /ASSEMBLY_ACC=CAM_ASM_000666 /TAXON_ID=230516 /ORGANISM="Chaetoceros curvisetus" /LENGTH=79 /DNA_ID=CAMNT_0051648519 /DNA_START=269 /DNA_END=508 /DNA_ORIENTATION=-